jgi:hypothetical protein
MIISLATLNTNDWPVYVKSIIYSKYLFIKFMLISLKYIIENGGKCIH